MTAPTTEHVRFLESLDRVNDAIRSTQDLDAMLEAALDTVLAVLACDRAWLLFPCDPGAPTWRVPMERSREGYPGAMAMDAEIPMLPEAQQIFEEALASGAPLAFDARTGRPLPPQSAETFGIRSQLVGAIRPHVGPPWLFGVHQCDHARIWSDADQHLFEQIGRRLADGLSSLLVLRDLRASERQFREVVEGTDDVVARLDRELRFRYVNPSGARVFGTTTDACVGVCFFDVLHPEDRAAARATMARCAAARTPSATLENRVVGRSGEVHLLLWTVNLHYDGDGLTDVGAIGRDVTERVRADEELRRMEQRLFLSQKMEALGTLAGGVAHDFNNILGAILGYADLTRLTIGDDAPAQAYLTPLLAATHRARELVQQILAFSRRAEHRTAPFDVGRVVREVTRLVRASIPRTIDIRTHLPTEPAVVCGDESRMHQVLMNLCTNAFHAMRQGGGVLDIALERVARDAALAGRDPDLARGPLLRLTVRDSGVGMDEATRARAFEPFFTTRERGAGSGMGLAVVHGVIRDHEGAIEVDSAPGEGTTVSVYLPEHHEPEPASDAAAGAPLPRGDGERVLLVDDEAPLADVGRETLSALGYRVTATTSSREALALFEADPAAYDVVLTDQTMPQLTGDALTARVHAVRPDVPVIVCTGYSDTLEGRSAADIGAVAILMKPVTRDVLAEAVHAALDRSGA